MTLQQLEYALALAKHGSFRKASESMYISQPGLSLQIQKLEESLGIILFDRSKSPIKPTKDGEVFLIRAEDLVIRSHQLQDFVEGIGNDYLGKLSVGIIPTLAPFLVPLFIEDLLKDYPEFEIDIQEMITEEVIRNVRSGDIDLGIISTPISVFGIDSTPIFYERFYFYTANEIDTSSISIHSVNYENLWILNEGNCFRDQINDFCDLKETRKNRQFNYHSNSIDALIRIVDNKGGLTILPELTTLTLQADQEEKISLIENKAREIGMITRVGFDKRRFSEKLSEYIQSHIPKHMLTAENLEVVDPGIEMN